MNSSVRISHPHIIEFSRWRTSGRTVEEGGRILSWVSLEYESPTLVSCIGSFDAVQCFNSISLDLHKDHPELFPNTFRFEISQDGKLWEPILQESDFHGGRTHGSSWKFSLTAAKYIKFLFLADRKSGNNHYAAAFGEFKVAVFGLTSLKVSSELDRLWVKENLIDGRSEYGWSSALRSKNTEEFIEFDLGSVNRVHEVRMLSKDDRDTFFPPSFRVSYSEDNISWHHLLNESGFLAEAATWYRWRFLPINIRYFKITIDEGVKTREGKFISQIIDIELYAYPDLVEKREHQSMPAAVPYSSVLRSGVVRLAVDGEVKEGVAVQGNDRRLKDATTDVRGIVELASNGEDREGVVVQGNDRRLKHATEDLPGIVRLARNGESRAGHALQSNDERLNLATEERAGFVELAFDGEDRAGVVVQGSDHRLKYATVEAAGIVKFASSYSNHPNEAVQGDDPRLKDATTETKGILRFATHGDSSPFAAIQGSDPRIKPATTEAKGIVELARNGEDREGVVVQGNDHRLKDATIEAKGIVALARDGEAREGAVVQGNDHRLKDARVALPHTHDYADKNHSYDSHSGTVKLEAEMGSPYKGIAPPPLSYAPITGINKGGGAALVGRAEEDGIVGAGNRGGVVGIGLDKGDALIGLARGGAGGLFISERGYSLVVGTESRGVKGSARSLFVNGAVRFEDALYFPADANQGTIAFLSEIESGDLLDEGELLVCTAKPGLLAKCTQVAATSVVGVYVKQASIVLESPSSMFPPPNSDDSLKSSPVLQKPRGFGLVAISGIVKLKVSAHAGIIEPGDLLVSSAKGGRAEKGTASTVKPGTVVAKSLERHAEGNGTIRALLLQG